MSSKPLSSEHWSDEPLSSGVPDSLGRDPFVSTIVSRISQVQASDPSTVFGIVGEWGSGKSSILNRVRVRLGDDWLVGDFTPWSSGDSGAMSLEFVSTLADILGEKQSDDLRRKLSRYAAFATPLIAAIPGVGAATKEIADIAINRLDQRPPWHAQFKELSSSIEAIGKKVLIIVDDVDRLGGQELLTLLRIVRLLGRFHGVHYLLAYDQDTVEDLLRSTGSTGRSAAFMEKIVQYPFESPPMPRAAIVRLLNEVLQELLERTGFQLDEVGITRTSELIALLSSQIRTPRTLGRLREHLLAFSSHVQSAELDLLDYVAITWLRLNSHGVWTQLPIWHEELRTGKDSSGLPSSEFLTEKDWISRIGLVSPGSDPNHALAMFSFLYAGVTFHGDSHYYERPQGLDNSRYLGRYLLLDIPEDDVRDEVVELAITDLLSGNESKHTREITNIIDQDNSALALLVLGIMAEVRRQSDKTSTRLVKFLVERLEVHDSDDYGFQTPQHSIRTLLAREVACALLSGLITAETVVNLTGEEKSLALIRLASRTAEYLSQSKQISRYLADYWLGQLPTRYAELQLSRQLGPVADLICYACEPEEISGSLDDKVPDFEAYVALASSFVYFAQWVGASIEYEMRFRSEAFYLLVSEEKHQQFIEEVRSEPQTLDYKSERLPTTEIAPQVRRAFAIDSIRGVSPDGFRDLFPGD